MACLLDLDVEPWLQFSLTCLLTTRYVPVLFKELILRNGGRLAPTLDLSSLAKISDGYTPGHIITAVKHVLTERRVQQVNFL